ncbi:hypothetical protein PVAP13_8NG229500 [Panicum virgatum]|uniref:Uncharacterized protein n=1 Tax=Panicum virgatum TaxID=38727 RepID=A0A8T0PGZ3_PANVG|nr:hypothetical protein PVAP13_8NG229500 [Panicum virgatum]
MRTPARHVPAPVRGRTRACGRPLQLLPQQRADGPCSSCTRQGADGPCSSCARQGAAVPAPLAPIRPQGTSRLSVAPSTSITMEEQSTIMEEQRVNHRELNHIYVAHY